MISSLLYKIKIVYDSNSECYIEVDRNSEIFHMPIRFMTKQGLRFLTSAMKLQVGLVELYCCALSTPPLSLDIDHYRENAMYTLMRQAPTGPSEMCLRYLGEETRVKDGGGRSFSSFAASVDHPQTGLTDAEGTAKRVGYYRPCKV